MDFNILMFAAVLNAETQRVLITEFGEDFQINSKQLTAASAKALSDIMFKHEMHNNAEKDTKERTEKVEEGSVKESVKPPGEDPLNR